MSQLAKTHIRHAVLSNRIVLARIGKDPTLALETSDAMSEFWQALASFAFGGKMPEPGASSEIEFGSGDEQFVAVVTRKAAEALK